MNKENSNLTTIQEFFQYHSNNPELERLLEASRNESYVLRCKNGSKIHIKKKNRGSFTRYCGGNVTDECIRKAKKSPNPAIRKKATFAENARKWKH